MAKTPKFKGAFMDLVIDDAIITPLKGMVYLGAVIGALTFAGYMANGGSISSLTDSIFSRRKSVIKSVKQDYNVSPTKKPEKIRLENRVHIKKYICNSKEYYIFASNSQHGLIGLGYKESYFSKIINRADRNNNEVILGSEVKSLIQLIGEYSSSSEEYRK